MILDTIAAASKKRVAKQKLLIPFKEMKRLGETACKKVTFTKEATLSSSCSTAKVTSSDCLNNTTSTTTACSSNINTISPICTNDTNSATPEDFPFEAALKKPELSLICEIKKASPSKGLIARDFPYLAIAQEYAQAGASAISVLTEPDFFLGNIHYLQEISQVVSIPLLRKDFIIDPYQIYEAKANGASAILLICALLDTDTLTSYIQLCHSLKMSALVEAHDPTEIQSALRAGARIIGVNNRNLGNFTVDFNNAVTLRNQVPDDILFLAESGIHTIADMKELTKAHVDGVLIGETLMRSTDKTATIQSFLQAGE